MPTGCPPVAVAPAASTPDTRCQSGVLVGGSVGFFGAPLGVDLHSHMAGVSAVGRGRNVGYALKFHQRGWASERGIEQITWTFDPLVARNAYFDLGKLGAVPTSYHRDFYGDIGDELGGADESDRLLVTWHLADARAGVAPDTEKLRAEHAAVAIDDSDPRDPRVRPDHLYSDVVVPIPADIETVKREDPASASVGVPVAITTSIGALLDEVQGYVDDRYGRIKLKIQPGWDIEPTRAVREGFGDTIALQVDANSAVRATSSRQPILPDARSRAARDLAGPLHPVAAAASRDRGG